jgi:septal ring factor EnvC (AmiA/AmiB activator)
MPIFDQEDTDSRIAAIEKNLEEISETLDFIKATIVKADTTITTVAEQVMPTVNELMQSPMLKMLGVGKKK